jgi:hypothetical protein
MGRRPDRTGCGLRIGKEAKAAIIGVKRLYALLAAGQQMAEALSAVVHGLNVRLLTPRLVAAMGRAH